MSSEDGRRYANGRGCAKEMHEKDPAVIAKLLGWHHAKSSGGWGWWRGITFKAWVDNWNPYTSDADAVMALLEWQRHDESRAVGWHCYRSMCSSTQHVFRLADEGGIYVQESHESFMGAASAALERWAEVTDAVPG